MIIMIIRSKIAPLLVCLAAALTACQTAPPNQGRTGGRLDPTHDADSELGLASLTSSDLVSATDRMARDIAREVDAGADTAPRVWIGEIENRSSRPEQDYQIFLDRLRAVLMASGRRHGLNMDFRRERQFVEAQRAREFGVNEPEHAAGAYRSGNEYVLTCTVRDMPSGGTNYYLLDYQLVQVVDNPESGPGYGAGTIVWENFYEVKFQ